MRNEKLSLPDGRQADKKDEELVILSLENPSNYLYLMKRYEDRLIRYILRISNLTKEDAEDVLQDTFISVFQNLNAFDSTFKFSSWIYRITHNKTISYIRKIQARPKTVDIEDKEIIERLIVQKELEIEVNNKILKEKLMAEIEKMDVKYKSVLVLRFIEELEYSEISDILRIPTNTVGTMINRAKKILKDKLG